jgi:hypothetical protein
VAAALAAVPIQTQHLPMDCLEFQMELVVEPQIRYTFL